LHHEIITIRLLVVKRTLGPFVNREKRNKFPAGEYSRV
jgi:hypothetical protein